MKGRRINKREFIKLGLLGTGGLICKTGWANSPVMGKKLSKWSREAVFYAQTPRGIRCQICPNECDLKEREVSDCHNRIVKDGKLYTMAFGNPCAVHIDPVEKKPLYHFLPQSKALSIATAGCNLACLNCQNWTISQVSPEKTRNFDLMPEAVVESAVKHQCESIAYTYSEPITFYEYVTETSKIARQEGIRNILVSNGYINEKPLRELCKVIDAANIDLKAFSDEIYLKLCNGKLDPILNTLKIMKEENVWLEITNLVVPEWTDDLDMIKRMCGWLVENGFQDTPLHFSRFYPKHKLLRLPSTPVTVLNKARSSAVDSGLKYVFTDNVPGSEFSNTFCPKCKKTVIGRRGFAIIENNLKNGRCGACGEPIAGVWE